MLISLTVVIIHYVYVNQNIMFYILIYAVLFFKKKSRESLDSKTKQAQCH